MWENYAPELPYRPGNPAMKDFVGWTGIGPIALLIENILGLHCDGANRRMEWTIRRTDRHGIDNLQLGKATVSVIAEARQTGLSEAAVTAISTSKFTLGVTLNGKRTERIIPPGVTSFSV